MSTQSTTPAIDHPTGQDYFPELKETARRAFYWVSFDPDGRGDRTRKEFGGYLQSDLQYLTEGGATPNH